MPTVTLTGSPKRARVFFTKGEETVYLPSGETGSSLILTISRVEGGSAVVEVSGTSSVTITPGATTGLAEGRGYFYDLWKVVAADTYQRLYHGDFWVRKSIAPVGADSPTAEDVQSWTNEAQVAAAQALVALEAAHILYDTALGVPPIVTGTYDTVAQLLAATDSYSPGNVILALKEFASYLVVGAADAYDELTASGVRLTYLPGPYGIPVLASGAAPGTTTDQLAKVQRVFDRAAVLGCAVDVRADTFRCDGTLRRKDVFKICSNDGAFYFPADISVNGAIVYDKWRNGAGNEVTVNHPNVSDVRLAFDIGGDTGAGVGFVIDGKLRIIGNFLSTFTAEDRSDIRLDVAAIGGRNRPVSECRVTGGLYIQGFAFPLFVPDISDMGAGNTRQIARFRGDLDVQRCLTELGYIGASSNGLDDTVFEVFRTTRCGGYGALKESRITSQHISILSWFRFGLDGTELGAQDIEASTMSVTDGSSAVTLSAAHDHLAAGDYIVISRAKNRQTGANEAIPLVTRVTAVSGTAVTLTSTECGSYTPSVTASGLEWAYVPPGIFWGQSHFSASSFYQEGYCDTQNFSNRGGVDISSFKLGGNICTGRYQAIFSTTSYNSKFRIRHVAAEALFSNMAETIIAFGAMEHSDFGLAGMTADIDWPVMDGETVKLQPFKAVEVPFFSTLGGKVSDTWSAGSMQQNGIVNISLNTPYGTIRGGFNSSGAFLPFYTMTASGLSDGLLFVRDAARIGSPFTTVSLDNGTPKTIYATMPVNTCWLVTGKRVSSQAFSVAKVGVSSAGDVTVLHQSGSAAVTFSASGLLLRGELTTAGTGISCTFTRIRLQ